MLKTITAICILALTAQCALANDANLAAAEKLAKATNMKERIDAMRLEAQNANERQITKVLEQVAVSSPNVTEKQREAMREASKIMMKAVEKSWSSEKATKIYVDALVELMPADFAENAAAYYATPAGKSALHATSSAEKKMLQYVSSAQDKALATAFAEFMTELKKIVTPAQQ